MALILYEGFDTKATADLGTIFNTVGPANTITQNGRNGGRALTSNYQNGDLNTKNLATPVDTIVFGFAAFMVGASGNNSAGFPFVAIEEGSTRHFGMGMQQGALSLFRGTTQFGFFGPTLPVNQWFYLEGRVRIHDTAGSIELRLNGAQGTVRQNIDTRNGGTGLADRFRIFPGMALSTNATHIDDLYVLDTSGTEYTDFLGDQRIINGATAPAAGDAARRVVFVAT